MKIRELICGLNSRSDLSPRGLISLLMLLYDMISFAIFDEFADESFLQALIGLLKEDQVEALAEWPVGLGGGEVFFLLYLGLHHNNVWKPNEDFPGLPSRGRKGAINSPVNLHPQTPRISDKFHKISK